MFLQAIRGYYAIQTGGIFTVAMVGIVVSSLAAEWLAKKSQRTLILAAFVVTIARDRHDDHDPGERDQPSPRSRP